MMLFARAIPSRLPPMDVARLIFGMLLMAVAFLAMIDPAFAAPPTMVGGFHCSSGTAVGTLYDAGMVCPTTLRMDNVFTFLICNIERLSSNLLGNMYCGIMRDMIPGVMGMLTLATLFFGIGFTIGVIPATAKDFQLFLIKMAFISVLATQSDIFIRYGYTLFVGGLQEGTAIALSAMYGDPSKFTTGTDVYKYLDGFLKQVMHFATDYVGSNWNAGNNPCQNAVFAVLAIMAVAFPPIFFIGVMIIFRVAITFLRAVFGYLYSIIGIVFLLTMAPLFLSFFLFKQTKPFFDKWIGYLVTFSLQMVILFAFLGFILSIDVKHVAGSLTDIIVPVQENFDAGTIRAPWEYCTICEFHVVNKDTGEPYPADRYGAGDIIEDGRLVCKDNPPIPIPAMSAVAPPSESDVEGVKGALLKFAATGLLSLLVLAYLVEYLLNYVAALAAFLAGGMGASYAPQLGGGETGGNQRISVDMPGGGLANSFEDGFTAGYTRDMSKTSIYSVTEGFTEAAKYLVVGEPRTGEDPGMVGSFTGFLINPHRNPYGH